MGFLGFTDDAAMYDSTPLENMFIMECLPAAPEAFLKVYIYARMLALHPETGDREEIKRALSMDDETLDSAFTYWERAGLMRRLTDNPPTYAFMPMRGDFSTVMEKSYYKLRDFNGALQGLFPPGSLVHPAQYSMANDWLNVLGFSQEAALALIRHTLANSKAKKPEAVSIFKTADKIAAKLADAGITDLAGVEKEFDRDERADKVAREVIRQFGMKRRATEPEIGLAQKWTREWEYSLDDILKACGETVKAQNPSFAYIDRILENKRGETGAYAAMKGLLTHLGARQTPTPEECEWYDARLAEGFEPETLRLAASRQARKGAVSFENLDILISKWRERGLYKAAVAEQFVARGRALLAEFSGVLSDAGIEKSPTEDDLTAYEGWKAYLPADLIAYAAIQSAGRSYPISYMRNLIERWKARGVSTLDAAKAAETKPAETKNINPALNYEQRSYDDMVFDDDFFMKEGREYMTKKVEGDTE